MQDKPAQKNKGVKRLLKACAYSYDGVRSAIKNEAAFRQELCVCIPLAIAAFFLNLSLEMKALLILSMLALLIVELLNSAVEECVNLASPEIHPLAKRAKDMASAAVSFAILMVASAWAFALYSIFCR